MICQNEPCGREFTSHPKTPRGRQRFCSTTCRQLKWQRDRYRSDPAFRERKLSYSSAHFERLNGMRYAKRLLQMRRAKAMHRRRQRSVGAHAPKG